MLVKNLVWFVRVIRVIRVSRVSLVVRNHTQSRIHIRTTTSHSPVSFLLV